LTDCTVSYVPANLMHLEWDEAAPLLDLACARLSDKMGLDDLFGDIQSGAQQLWVVKVDGKTRAAFTTMVDAHPRCSILRVMLIGGRDMRLWRDNAFRVIKDAAQRLGCKAIEVNARLGWAKYAAEYGFKESARIYELEI
jgi:hypothetical protein